MHVAVSEFARHVVGLDGANSTEMDPETPFPVIDLLPEQKEVEDLGGTMRLGAQAVEIVEGTRTALPLEPLAGSMIDAPEALSDGSIVSVQATLDLEGMPVLIGAPVLIGSPSRVLGAA